MKTFYVNQVPVEAVIFKVVDELYKGRSLAAYTAASVIFTAPDRTVIDGGDAVITDAATGTVTYNFPATTLFTQRGEYKMRLRLENGEREDYCDVISLQVQEELEVTL